MQVAILLYKYIYILCTYTGSLEISIATMKKGDRASEAEVYVFAFVPCHQIPKRSPDSLDPFLEPFVTEMEDIFIEGGV